jgi:hypothetical protein
MDGLYPIIRRVRRPLVSNQPAAASVVATTGHGNAREAEPTANIQQPTPNIEVENGARQEVLPHGQRPTPDERKERHARKAKEA